MPTMQMAPSVHSAAPQPKMASSTRPLTYFMRKVLMKRLHRKSDMAAMLYICAVALLMPRWSAYWMMKVHTMICAAT